MIETFLYNNTSNNIVIPWSGGVDSTLIIFKVIKFFKKNVEQTKNLKIILVSGTQDVLNQHKQEKISREKIIKHIEKKYPSIFKQITLINFGESLLGYDACNTETLHQPYFWITYLLGHYNKSTFLLGYHKGDDFWTILDKFQKVVDVSLEYLAREDTNIYYPLARMYKDEIYDELPNKVKKMVWYCESANSIDILCDKCPSCITHNKFIK